ncbi:MAG: PrsW family intramembrane metalloprotease [Oscillibacter sp.]|nr:PrsW family intramembrane metalloprotease [Oscillibacter sp.]
MPIMFLGPPLTIIAAIYILAAVLPAFLLLRYIYRQDKVEKEPIGLLLKLLAMGVLSALCSILLERIGQRILHLVAEPGTVTFVLLLAFVVVAMVEEGTKFYFLRRATWNNPNFNYRFDGIVYAVFVSLGFAAYENIRYVMSYGLSVALPRAVSAIPGHMSFAVFMGLFYGRARLCHGWGKERACRRNLRRAYVSAVLLHGFYDACAMIGTTASMVTFLVFVALMFLTVARVVRRESERDVPV